MQWFKHYQNVRKNELVKEIIKKFGAVGYARYWGLLEILCEKFDGESSEVIVHIDDLHAALFIKQNKKLTEFLEKFDELSVKVSEKFGKSSVKVKKFQDNFYFFDAPILLNLQGKDHKFATKERQENAPKNKEERTKNKDKEKEINKEKICSFQNLENSISFTEVTNLFNNTLPKEHSKKGRVKYTPNFANNTILEKFDQILGHSDFKGPEGWKKLFNEVLESDFLMGISEKNFVVTLDWLLDTSNIRKVLGGQYSNGKDFARQESDARLNKMLDEYYANKVD